MILANTKRRILQYLDYKGIAKGIFFQETGLKRGLLDGDKLDATVSDAVIAKIIAKYRDLNVEWLLTGEGEMLKNPAGNLDNNTKDSTFIPNSFTGLTDEQIEKAMDEVMLKRLLKMYEDGLIYSAASVKEYQQRIAELMNENAKLSLEVERLHQKIEKHQEGKKFEEESSKPTR